MAITWICPPRHIAETLQRRTAAMEPALNANAQATASRGQARMVSDAPWTDRTGYARASLFGEAEGTDVVLGTTNGEYGPFLELGTSRMAARPVIVPTANAIAPEYFEDSAEIVLRKLGGG